jgi:hypothetical protein
MNTPQTAEQINGPQLGHVSMSQFTSEWYHAQLAKRGQRLTVAADAVTDESDLHNEIIAECRRRGWIALHSSMASPTKRNEGEPDFEILADGGRVLLVECKSREGKLSPAQLAFKSQAERLGHAVHIVRSMREFLALL